MSLIKDIMKLIGVIVEEEPQDEQQNEMEQEMFTEENEVKAAAEEVEREKKLSELYAMRQDRIDMNPFYDCQLCSYDKFTKNWVYENTYKHILEDGTELVITAYAEKDSLLKGSPFSMQIKLIAPGKDYVIRRIHFILDDRLFHFTDGAYSDGFGLLRMNRVTKEFYNKLVDARYIALQVECTAFTKLPAETKDDYVADNDKSERRRGGFFDKVLNGGYDFDKDDEKGESVSAMSNRYGDEKFTIDPIPEEEITGIIDMARMIRDSGVWEIESGYDTEPKNDCSEPLR